MGFPEAKEALVRYSPHGGGVALACFISAFIFNALLVHHMISNKRPKSTLPLPPRFKSSLPPKRMKQVQERRPRG